jgi:hypothetical protein
LILTPADILIIYQNVTIGIVKRDAITIKLDQLTLSIIPKDDSE